MGHSASARLIYGIDFGDAEQYDNEVPDWLLAHVSDQEHPVYGQVPALKGTGVEFFTYGYESDASAIGVSLAWAIDYGADCVALDELNAQVVIAGPKIRAVLAKLGAPSWLVPKCHVIVSYG